TNINDPARSPHNQPAKNHAFDHQIRRAKENLAILKRSRLAFVTITDHIFRCDLRLANLLPLLVSPSAGPAHSQESRGFQSGENFFGSLFLAAGCHWLRPG